MPVHMYACMPVHIYTCMQVAKNMHVCVYACRLLYKYAYMHVCMHTCRYICIYACMHVCIYAYLDASVTKNLIFSRVVGTEN